MTVALIRKAFPEPTALEEIVIGPACLSLKESDRKAIEEINIEGYMSDPLHRDEVIGKILSAVSSAQITGAVVGAVIGGVGGGYSGVGIAKTITLIPTPPVVIA